MPECPGGKLRAILLWSAGLLLTGGPATALSSGLPTGERPGAIRAQIDTVGYATNREDMALLLRACRELEEAAVGARRQALNLEEEQPWAAAIMPHDDYIYAGRVYLHLLPGLQAPRWIVFGVCHACLRLGIKDRLIFEDCTAWRIAGQDIPTDPDLRDALLATLGPEAAVVDVGRHAAEHSVEGLLPWLQEAVPAATFVPVLVPGMSWERMQQLADALAEALATICQDRNWCPGPDLGILISADAVHYGCEGWGDRGGYHPFGCDEAGHAAGRAQDITLAEATLAGPLTDDGLARFTRLVWNPDHSEYPYRITWCGLYSIPLGLATARRWQEALALPPLTGHLLRYGDSVSDGRLALPDCRLGVTAANELTHWVGYAALGYLPLR